MSQLNCEWFTSVAWLDMRCTAWLLFALVSSHRRKMSVWEWDSIPSVLLFSHATLQIL